MSSIKFVLLAGLSILAIALGACVAGPEVNGDSSESSDGMPAAETTAGTGAQASSGDGPASSGGETEGAPTPFEQAGLLACAARDSAPTTSVPMGEGVYRVTGFRMENEFPQRFLMDSTSPEIGWWPGDYVCYDVGPPQDFEGEWWFTPDDWLEDDGEIHVYMATQGIDDVIYYGSGETFLGEPGAPVTPSVVFDAGALCPELAQIWIPDINAHPDDAGRICMHHSSPMAEAVFVRVP